MGKNLGVGSERVNVKKRAIVKCKTCVYIYLRETVSCRINGEQDTDRKLNNIVISPD